jgi:AcrR family transcriptional regulator
VTRRGRPPSFSREELVEAAKSLGPENIGLQNVAKELGVARTSLYWHVRDQSELGELVLASILSEGAISYDWAPPDAPWDVWLEAYARMLRSTLLRGGGWLRYGTSRLFYARGALVNADRLVGALVEAGFSIEEASYAFTMVSELVFANVRSHANAEIPEQQGRDAFLASVRSVDREDLPHLRAALKARGAITLDMQFEYDLACALAGIRARASQQSRS